ncbi:hypothetical protein GCM10025787_35400 [Saccharopolyspora rosea]|uniref:Uncharacterized protein n=1 Tax=Saccharopolyspora rosea TaxID=524884 RepID=A0ABW3G2P9_9PSEU
MATPDIAVHQTDADRLAAELSVFVERTGWPVSIDTRHQRLIVRTDDAVLDALRVRAELAEPIAHEMSMTMLSGPVIRDMSWWTFLTAPRPHGHVELPADLHHAPIRAVPRGGEVVLPPMSATEQWQTEPRPDRPLPPWSVVVGLARSVVHRRGG